MNSVLSTALIAADSYNELPLIHRGLTIEMEHVLNLGAVIVKHGVELYLGVQLLHRHFLLPNRAVMHASSPATGITITQPTPVMSLDRDYLQGTAFYVTAKNAFEPYEYTTGTAVQVPSALLDELASYIIAHGLQRLVALGVVGDVTTKQNEMLIADDPAAGPYGTITQPIVDNSELDESAIQTTWTFKARPDGTTELNDGKQYCQPKVKSPDEAHKVFVGSLTILKPKPDSDGMLAA